MIIRSVILMTHVFIVEMKMISKQSINIPKNCSKKYERKQKIYEFKTKIVIWNWNNTSCEVNVFMPLNNLGTLCVSYDCQAWHQRHSVVKSMFNRIIPAFLSERPPSSNFINITKEPLEMNEKESNHFASFNNSNN